jgi:hypothetical protein
MAGKVPPQFQKNVDKKKATAKKPAAKGASAKTSAGKTTKSKGGMPMKSGKPAFLQKGGKK